MVDRDGLREGRVLRKNASQKRPLHKNLCSGLYQIRILCAQPSLPVAESARALSYTSLVISQFKEYSEFSRMGMYLNSTV